MLNLKAIKLITIHQFIICCLVLDFLMYDVNYVQLALKKFTFCTYFVRVCGWCIHIVCYRWMQSISLTVFFSNLVTKEKKRKKKYFSLLRSFRRERYDAKGDIYVSYHMFSCEHFYRIIKKSNEFFLQFQHIQYSCRYHLCG